MDQSGQPVKRIWDAYNLIEKGMYKKILAESITKIEGTLKEISDSFGVSTMHMCAFFDGIHEAVDGLPPLEDLEEETPISFDLDFERLYMKMVEFKAEPLYTLTEWDTIIDADRQKELYTQVKSARTVVRDGEKIGRNEPCPCGSGKKYKFCCLKA